MGFFDKLSRKIFRRPPNRALKLNRNEACWCGSGKKYKKCHHDADRKYFASRGSSCKPSS